MSNSVIESSQGLRSPRQRNFYSPNFLTAFSNKQGDENCNNNLTSPSNSSNTPSASSSASSGAALSKSKTQPFNHQEAHDTNTNNIQYANSSKFFNNVLTSKQQNLIRSAKLAVSPTSTYVKSKTKNFTSKSDNLTKQQQQPTSPLDFYPRKLFQPQQQNGQHSEIDKLPDTLSMSGSLYLENSASTTDASTGTGRIVNKNCKLILNNKLG